MAIAPDTAPSSAPPPPRRRGRRVLRVVGLVLLLLVLLVAVAAWWLLGTSSGTNFVLQQAASRLGPGVRIEGARGRLGGAMHADRIVVDRPELYAEVVDADLDTSPPLGGPLVVHKLHAREVTVRTAPSQKKSEGLPLSIAPPLPVRVEDGRIDRLRIGTIARVPGGEATPHDMVLEDIVVRGEGDARRWKIDEAAVTTEYGRASVSGTVGATRPFDLHVDAKAQGNAQGKP